MRVASGVLLQKFELQSSRIGEVMLDQDAREESVLVSRHRSISVSRVYTSGEKLSRGLSPRGVRPVRHHRTLWGIETWSRARTEMEEPAPGRGTGLGAALCAARALVSLM